jgi:hypothetical protein
MPEASGVASEFEADERGAGITVFAPTDDAFTGLLAGDRLQSLPADRKATRANGSVAIDTGVVQAFITCTVFDQNPVAVFAGAASPPPAATAPEASESASAASLA